MQRLRVAAFWFALEHIGGFGGVADRLNAYNIYRGDPGLITSDVDRFETVTAAEIQAAAERYLAGRPEDRALGRRARQSASRLPPLDRKVPPESAIVPGYRPPVPRIIELAGGIPLWVFPRSDLPTVTGSIVMPGGAGVQQPGQAGLAQLAVAMLEEGTVSRSAEQIALAAESMGATISTTCGWGGAYVSFKCLKADFAASLELAADILLNPTFPEAEWDRVRGQALAGAQGRARPRGVARAPGACWRPSIPKTTRTGFRSPGTEAGRRAARSIRSGRFSRAVSDFRAGRRSSSPATSIPTRWPASSSAGSSPWPGSGTAIPEPPEIERSTRPRLLLLDRPGAAQAVVRAGYVGLARSSPDFDHVLVVNQILGGQFTSRLNESLREERGLTYGVRSSFDCRKRPGPFTVSASVQTEKVGEALEQIRIELEAIAGDRPPTAARARRCPPLVDRGPPPPLRIARRAREPIRRPGHSRSARRSRRRLLPTAWPRSISTRSPPPPAGTSSPAPWSPSSSPTPRACSTS